MNSSKNEQNRPGRWRFSGFSLDAGRRLLVGRDGEAIRLPARAFDVLLELVRAAGQPVAKNELLEAAWKGRIVEENSLSRAISTLRQVLDDDAASPRFIATIQGEGYQFVAPIEDDEISPPDSMVVAPGPSPAGGGQRPRGRTRGMRRSVFSLLALLTFMALTIWLWPKDRSDLAHERPATGLLELEILTDFPGSHGSPALSPDGEWLAFTSNATGSSQVWLMSLRERVPRQLTHEDPGAREPAWSPDGQQIAYVIEGWGIGSISPLNMGVPRRLVEDGGYPAFSPAGDWLVFEYGREVHRARIDGSGASRIEGVPERAFVKAQALPVVSPDGKEIAYFLADNAVAGDFWRIPIQGGEPRRVTRDGVPASGADWVPGGDALVVSSTRNGRANLWYMPLDGSDPVPLTSGVGDDSRPVVSPDGKSVVYVHQQTRWQLVSSDPRTGEEQVLVERRDPIMLPAVSPDGRSATWFSANPSRVELFTLDLDERIVNRVFEGADRLPTAPTWSGDGRSLYYHDLASMDLRRVDIDGRNDVLAAAGVHWRNGMVWISFQPGGHLYLVQERLPDSGRIRSVARSLSGESDITFEGPDLFMPSWSRDGTRMIGVGADKALWQCRLLDRRCDPVLMQGEPVRGDQPRWSRDGRRVYLRRSTADAMRHSLWVFDPADETLKPVLEIGPIEANNVTYDIAADDRIIWSRTSTADSKIWRGVLP